MPIYTCKITDQHGNEINVPIYSPIKDYRQEYTQEYTCPRCGVPFTQNLSKGERSAHGKGQYICYPCHRWEKLSKGDK